MIFPIDTYWHVKNNNRTCEDLNHCSSPKKISRRFQCILGGSGVGGGGEVACGSYFISQGGGDRIYFTMHYYRKGGLDFTSRSTLLILEPPLPRDNYCTVPYVSRRKTKEPNSSWKRKSSLYLVNHQNERVENVPVHVASRSNLRAR